MRAPLDLSDRAYALDLIGDIHGHADALTRLLDQLGYRKKDRRWHHPSARILFLGDLIDRGPAQRETVEIAHELCESGLAQCLMGNHEFNAVGFVTERNDAPGQFVRSHTENHIRQHEAFLDAYANDQAGYLQALDWFKTLPLWAEASAFRAVHACWHAPSQAALAPWLTGHHAPKDSTFFTDSGIPGSLAWEAREVLLNGLETRLPGEASFVDYYGTRRRKIRVNWWSPAQTTYRDAAVIDDSQRDRIPDIPLQEVAPDYAETLCFFGHYWMRGQPRVTHPRALCLDYSVALEDGFLCSYRFKGESDAVNDHLTWVGHT